MNPIKQRFFKAFRRVDGKLVSVNPNLHRDWVHTYTEWAINKCKQGRFFVFETHEQATNFITAFDFDAEVWEVEGYNNVAPKSVICIGNVADKGEDFWKSKLFLSPPSDSSTYSWPFEGTRFSKSIRLIKKL